MSTLPGANRDTWLAAITDFYLESRDYNGLAVHDGFTADQTTALVELVEDGLVEVRTTETSVNPHVRREPGTVSREQQVQLLRAGDCERYVLYPTPAALEGDARVTRLATRPYEQRLAGGAAVLDIVYFDLAVLENYRNDPRYYFTYWDFGVFFSISDDAYMDPEEAERDKVSAAHVGFAYSEEAMRGGPIRRYLAVFVKDLAAMTPEHQQRWSTYEADRDGIEPHPQWIRPQLFGEFPEGPGTFSMCLTEMQHINQLSEMLWGEAMFETADRPREWGWMIRGSSGAYKSFAHLTDKLLAENLRSAGLDAAGAPTEKDGNRLGTLKRLEGLLVQLGVSEDSAYQAMGAWHEINNTRHQQAHVLEDNAVDQDLLGRQVEIMDRLARSLAGIRMVLAKHPAAEGWEPDYPDSGYFML